MRYKPWKFVACLPVILVLEGAHIVCEFFHAIDRNFIEPIGEDVEDWLSD